MPNTLPPLSLYVHIPWCIQKCPYCDFNSHAVKEPIPEARYIQALLNDLQRDVTTFSINRSLSSIFIGGGTPSLLSPQAISDLLAGISAQISLLPDVEITLEANPSTVEANKFAEFNSLGINRLSIGIQSFNDTHLQKLGRVHDAKQAFLAVERAYSSGFSNVNLDLMFGLPTQTLAESQADIQTAIDLDPQHLSFYQLTLEPNTYFHRYPPSLPDDQISFIMQTNAQQQLAARGFEQYEVSAYSKNNACCKHNLNYWQFGDYLGIGAGAHGKISCALPNNIVRTVKLRSPAHYLATQDNRTITPVQPHELPLEFMMNHARLKQGFSLKAYEYATGLEASTLKTTLSPLITEGLLVEKKGHYRCTEQGWNFLDCLLEKFIP